MFLPKIHVRRDISRDASLSGVKTTLGVTMFSTCLVSSRIFVNRPLSSIETALLTETKNDARMKCPLPSTLIVTLCFANDTDQSSSSLFCTTSHENRMKIWSCLVNLPGLSISVTKRRAIFYSNILQIYVTIYIHSQIFENYFYYDLIRSSGWKINYSFYLDKTDYSQGTSNIFKESEKIKHFPLFSMFDLFHMLIRKNCDTIYHLRKPLMSTNKCQLYFYEN